MDEPGPLSGPPDDVEILREIGQGRLERFDLIVDRYKAGLLRYLFQQVGDAHLAEDLAQETFLRVFRSASGKGAFTGGASATTWVFTIARNLVRDFRRSQARRPLSLESEMPEEESRAADPPDPRSLEAPVRKLLWEEENRRIRDALQRLPEPQREVLDLKAFGDLKLAEISQVLRCPLATVKSRLRYAIQRIRQALSGSPVKETTHDSRTAESES